MYKVYIVCCPKSIIKKKKYIFNNNFKSTKNYINIVKKSKFLTRSYELCFCNLQLIKKSMP